MTDNVLPFAPRLDESNPDHKAAMLEVGSVAEEVYESLLDEFPIIDRTLNGIFAIRLACEMGDAERASLYKDALAQQSKLLTDISNTMKSLEDLLGQLKDIELRSSSEDVKTESRSHQTKLKTITDSIAKMLKGYES